MNFKKTAAIITLISACYLSNAQTEGVSISSTVAPPDPSAMLDVQSINKGVLLPRVSLTSITSSLPIQPPVATGLIVYNYNPSFGEGFYYWNGTIWIRLGDGLWSRIGATNDIRYAFGKVQVGPSTGSAPTFDFEVNYPDPGHLQSCKFEGTVGVLYFEGIETILPPAGTHGAAIIPGLSALKQKSKLSEGISTGVAYIQYDVDDNELLSLSSSPGVSMLMSQGELSFGSDGSPVAFFDNTGSFVNTSDSTLKTNISDLPTVIAKIKNCRPVMYNWKKNPQAEKDYGFLAQEMELIFPELVSDHTVPASGNLPARTIKGINYEGLTSILIKGMKEQQAKIESLEQRIQALENH
jgi:hypothetical protein